MIAVAREPGRQRADTALQAARAAGGGLLAALVAAMCGAAISGHPSAIHPLLAVLLVVNIGMIALRSPRQAIVVTFAFLPFLAMTRRLLILYDGWHSADPLLLVAPVVAVLLLVQRGREAQQPRTRLATLVLVLLAWTALSVLNPLGGGLRANAAGLLFVGAPLLWFFVGRDLVDRATAGLVLRIELGIGVVVAVYGLAQTLGRWPGWDRAWLSVAGYQALHVGDLTRAFGPFSSSAEYASFLSLAIAIAISLALHRELGWLALLPLLAVAAFLDGSRGIIVLTAGAVIVQLGLRTRRPGFAVAIVAAGALSVIGGVHAYKGSLLASASGSGNAIVQHQVRGLASPLNTSNSTLPAHWRLFVNGIRNSIHTPLGSGPGSTNLAGSRFGLVVAPTEVELSNEFSGLGIPGGLLFAGIVILTWRRALALYRRASDPLVLAAAGMLFVLLGQWLNGGYYAIAPLVWLVVGWLEGEWSRVSVEESHA